MAALERDDLRASGPSAAGPATRPTCPPRRPHDHHPLPARTSSCCCSMTHAGTLRRGGRRRYAPFAARGVPPARPPCRPPGAVRRLSCGRRRRLQDSPGRPAVSPGCTRASRLRGASAVLAASGAPATSPTSAALCGPGASEASGAGVGCRDLRGLSGLQGRPGRVSGVGRQRGPRRAGRAWGTCGACSVCWGWGLGAGAGAGAGGPGAGAGGPGEPAGRARATEPVRARRCRRIGGRRADGQTGRPGARRAPRVRPRRRARHGRSRRRHSAYATARTASHGARAASTISTQAADPTSASQPPRSASSTPACRPRRHGAARPSRSAPA